MSTNNEQNTPIVDDDPLMEQFINDMNPQSTDPGQSPEGETGEQTPENTENPESQNDGDGNDNPDADDNSPIDNTNPPSNEDFDLNKYLEQSSEGLFKSEDDFKAGLNKIKEYETLQQQINDLKAEKENIFANKEIETLNRLHKEGKTEEQINEFMRLSKVDLDQVEAKEVLIQREIMNGKTRALAEKFIERKYGLDKINLDEESLTPSEIEYNKSELDYANELMKADADPLRKDLKSTLAELSSTESPSEKALKEAAAKQSYRTKLDPFVNQLASSFPKQLVVGDESTGQLTYDVPSDLLEKVKTQAYDYFMDQEVSPESVQEFVTAQKAMWLYENQKEILESIKQQTEVATEKRVRAEYENPQGLPKSNATPVAQEVNINDQLMNIANEMY